MQEIMINHPNAWEITEAKIIFFAFGVCIINVNLKNSNLKYWCKFINRDKFTPWGTRVDMLKEELKIHDVAGYTHFEKLQDVILFIFKQKLTQLKNWI